MGVLERSCFAAILLAVVIIALLQASHIASAPQHKLMFQDSNSDTTTVSTTTSTTSSSSTTVPETAYANFYESGLEAGYVWGVVYNGVTEEAVSPSNIIFQVVPGGYNFSAYAQPQNGLVFTAMPSNGYVVAGNSTAITFNSTEASSTSTTTVTTSATSTATSTTTQSTVTTTIQLKIYTVFTEGGLPINAPWEATYNSVPVNVIAPGSIVFTSLPGNYPFDILPVVVGNYVYEPHPANGILAAGSSLNVTYFAQAATTTTSTTSSTSTTIPEGQNLATNSPYGPLVGGLSESGELLIGSQFSLPQLQNMTPLNGSQYRNVLGLLEGNITNASVQNVVFNVTYGSFYSKGNLVGAGSRFNYVAYSGSNSILHYRVAVVKATPSLTLSVAGVKISGSGATDVVDVPVLDGRKTYNVSITLNGSVPHNNLEFGYNVTVGGRVFNGYSANVTDGNVGRTLRINGLPAGKDALVTFDSPGNANYSPVDPSAKVVPINITDYVPITITNNAVAATPKPFQQMLVVNSITYQAYESSNMSNIEFFYTNGTLVPSWFEGNQLNELQANSLNTVSNDVFWLNLWNGINPSSANAVTVFMGFAPTSINLLDNVVTGAAPQLQCPYGCPETSYGQYDNGNSVFLEYWNFSNGLPAGWSSSASLTDPGNGIRITRATVAVNSPLVNPGNIVEANFYITTNGMTYRPGAFYFGKSGSGAATTTWALSETGGDVANAVYIAFNGMHILMGTAVKTVTHNVSYGGAIMTPVSTTYGLSTQYLPASNAIYAVNDLIVSSNTPAANTPASQQYYIEFISQATDGAAYGLNWTRVRAYPPNGIMPSVTFNSLPPNPGHPTVTITPDNPIITPGGNVLLTASATGGSGSYTWQWYTSPTYACNSLSILSGQTSATYLAAPAIPTYYCAVANSLVSGVYLLGNASSFVSTPIIPPNIIYWVPITLTNNQNVGTGTGFQEMVAVNSLEYQQYETNTLTNIEFAYTNGTLIDSWLDGNLVNEQSSNDLYTSGNTVYWLRMNTGLGIGDLSSQVILMGFAVNSVTLMNGTTTGEAPQLSCSNPTNTISGCGSDQYAEYDNGNTVFSFYDDFRGAALNTSKWSGTVGGTGASETVDNGLKLTAETADSAGIVSLNAYTAWPYWFAGLITTPKTLQGSTKTAGFEESTSVTFAAGGKGYESGYMVGSNGLAGSANVVPIQISSSGTAALGTKILSNGNFPQVLGIGWNATASQNQHYDYFANSVTTLSTIPINAMYFSVVLAATTPTSSTNSFTVQWVNARTYPPLGIMPGATPGTLEGVINFTESGLPAGATWNVIYNGITLNAIAPNSIVFADPPGSYSYTIANVFSAGNYIPNPSSGTSAAPNTVLVSFTNTNACQISLSTSSILFGDIIASETYSTTQVVTDVNNGGVPAYLWVYGGDWISGDNNFGVGNTLWDVTSDDSYAGNALTLVTSNTFVLIPANTGSGGSNSIYFGLGIPTGQVAGTYTQNIVLTNVC